MGIFNNILNDIEFKGGKTTLILKFVIGFAILAIIGGFVLGQFKTRHLNKLDNIESIATKGMKKTEQLERRMKIGFYNQNKKIDKIYDDGIESFNDYRKFNNKQIMLVIDYGQKNKELLKKIIELNSNKKAIDIENNLNFSKKDHINDTINLSSSFIKLDTIFYDDLKPPLNLNETNIKTYYVYNAPKNFIDTLNLNKYKIIKKEKDNLDKNLYNLIYIKK